MKIKDLTKAKHWFSELERLAIIEIIHASFANVEPLDYLAKYFDDSAAFERKLRLYFDNKKLVGYCLLTFTDEGGTTVIRASAAFFLNIAKAVIPFSFLCREF